MEVKKLEEKEIDISIFAQFDRYQKVTRCWRKIEGRWVIKEIAFIEQWGDEDYKTLVNCLKNTVKAGGVVLAGMENGVLKAFASVEGSFLGTKYIYMDLSSLHVSCDLRGKGAGRMLFLTAADWARKKGAERLYISAHSSVESQAFYKAMGCVEAEEYDKKHTDAEPCDCQLEYRL